MTNKQLKVYFILIKTIIENSKTIDDVRIALKVLEEIIKELD